MNQNYMLQQCKAISRNLNSDEVARGKISYMDIYEDHLKQKEVTSLFSKLLNIKKTMTENVKMCVFHTTIALYNFLTNYEEKEALRTIFNFSDLLHT